MSFISPKVWGRTPYGGRQAWDWGRVKGLCLHHSVTSAPRRHKNCAAVVRAIEHGHRNQNYRTIAYNFIVCRHGDVFVGRGFRDVSGANGTADTNREYVAVCFLGSSPEVTPRRARAVRQVRKKLLKRAEDAKRVVPHSDLKATACPGNDVRAYIEDKGYRVNCRRVKKRIGEHELAVARLVEKLERGRCG